MKIKILQVREATGSKINNPADVFDMMREEALADREIFWVLHLNTRNKIIEKEICHIGCLDSSVVHPREVFKKAVINSAYCIMTVHNHPSGALEPSKEDKAIWERLRQAGDILGIELLDNLVISSKGIYSQKRGN